MRRLHCSLAASLQLLLFFAHRDPKSFSLCARILTRSWPELTQRRILAPSRFCRAVVSEWFFFFFFFYRAVRSGGRKKIDRFVNERQLKQTTNGKLIDDDEVSLDSQRRDQRQPKKKEEITQKKKTTTTLPQREWERRARKRSTFPLSLSHFWLRSLQSSALTLVSLKNKKQKNKQKKFSKLSTFAAADETKKKKLRLSTFDAGQLTKKICRERRRHRSIVK